MLPLNDREEAGRFLALKLRRDVSPESVLFGIVPGGVRIAAAIASAYDLPVDLLLVRTLVDPAFRELPWGAVAEGGVCRVDFECCARHAVPPRLVTKTLLEAQGRIAYDRRQYARMRPRVEIGGRPVVIAADAIDSIWTIVAASDAAMARGASAVAFASAFMRESVLEEAERRGIPVRVLATGISGAASFPPAGESDVVAALSPLAARDSASR